MRTSKNSRVPEHSAQEGQSPGQLDSWQEPQLDSWQEPRSAGRCQGRASSLRSHGKVSRKVEATCLKLHFEKLILSVEEKRRAEWGVEGGEG